MIDRSLSLVGSVSDATKIIYSKQSNIIEYTGDGLLSISGIEFIREGIEWDDVIWIKSGQVDISDCIISAAIHFEKE